MHLKVIQDSYVKSDGTAALYIRVTVERKYIKLPLNISIQPQQFDSLGGRVKSGVRNCQLLNATIQREYLRVHDLLFDLSQQGILSYDQAVQLLTSRGGSVHAYMDKVVETHRNSPGTYLARKSSADKVKRFAPNLSFGQITTLWLREYDAWMQEQGQATNTRYIALKWVRNVCNLARREGLMKINPFEGFDMKQEKVHREGLTKSELQVLIDAPLIGIRALARDIFIFQVHCFGMRISDALTVKSEQVKNGLLTYKMIKTGDEMRVKLTKFALSKVGKSGYIFSFPKDTATVRDHQWIKTKTAEVNKFLKLICKEQGIREVSTKYARLTWTQLAKEASGGDMRLLQDALGHGSVITTEIYAGGADFDRVNELNAKMWG